VTNTTSDMPQQAAVALATAGYDIADFDIHCVPAPLATELGLDDAVLTVRRRSTGAERMYLGTPDAGWCSLLQRDASSRAFGDRRRKPR
jgi:hypothetical protein